MKFLVVTCNSTFKKRKKINFSYFTYQFILIEFVYTTFQFLWKLVSIMHYHIPLCQSLCSRVYGAAQFKKSYKLLLVSLSWISKQILVSISSHTEKTNTFVVLNSFSIANPHWFNLKLALNYIKHQMTAIASLQT